jgi:SAM-dependent methyltransferase
MSPNEAELNFYKEHPKTCDPEDFWGQVKRTVNGKPMPQEQINMIVARACKRLDLRKDDVLLDLCCGNGALTTYLFECCVGGLGVDFSEYLINIAHKHFIKKPEEQFVLQDVVDFVRTYENPGRFSKAICYGSFMFLPHNAAYDLLRWLRLRFPGINRLFIGNLPDKSKMACFFSDREYTPGIENDPGSPIGIWRTEQELVQLAETTGWHASISRMPTAFYAAHYRFDAILKPMEEHP